LSILEAILQRTRADLAQCMERRALAEVEAAARAAPQPIDALAALRRAPEEPLRIIAEFKRASPSAGPIWPEAEVEDVARAYQASGASAISILTDEPHFDGHLDFLRRARQAVSLPLLRKDFIVDPYQLAEARAAGADAVLLIVAALEPTALAELHACARSWKLTPLVEVHDEREAEVAVNLGAELIGVNHRNLATFEIDLSLTGRLARTLPASTVLVAESGLKSAAELRRMAEEGAHAALIGESLMRDRQPGRALQQLLEAL
jgi:indole-3-glycerol phosphate synthase